MSQESALHLGQQCLWLIAQVAAPAVLAGMGVGLVVSIFQAATQIQDQSLMFVPKMAALMTTLLVAGGWMMLKVVDFTQTLILSIPTLIR